MSSEDEDMEFKYRPDSPDEVTKATNVIPPLSKDKYNKVYDDFQKWNKINGAPAVAEKVLLKYFSVLSQKNKPTTLWAYYSMIKATLRANDNIDITSWTKVLDFLKRNKAGYKPVKPKMFSEEEIEKFLTEAPDETWLDSKVVCIFGINGTYSAGKLFNMKVEHIKQYEDMFWVIIPNAETKHSYTITGTFFNIVQKYVALRPKNTIDNRFFVHYHDGKCTEQPFGKNRFNRIPRAIAKYLNLPESELYLGASFRISSANEFLARHSVRRSLANKGIPNTDTFNSTNDAKRNDQHNQHNDYHRNDHDIEYSLDYETGLLKTSSVRCITPPTFAASNENDNTNVSEHLCTASCSQVKCVMEGNEKSALHAFNTMKPLDYAITEVIPGQYASDPTCRWIVAYSHFNEPVSFFNSEEKFQEIIRSMPGNVKVVQKYVRGNSSKLFAAYVVVYGVKCRCQKPIFGPVSVQPSDLFRKTNSDPFTAQAAIAFEKQNFDPLSSDPSDALSFSIDDIKCEV